MEGDKKKKWCHRNLLLRCLLSCKERSVVDCVDGIGPNFSSLPASMLLTRDLEVFYKSRWASLCSILGLAVRLALAM